MDLRSRNKVQVQGNMSSMTDLVFLLMIFFIILSTMAKDQFSVDLPSSKGVKETMKDATVGIAVGADNQYYIDPEMQTPLSIEDLQKHILSEQKALLEEGHEKVHIRISADRNSQFEKFSDLVVFAKQNGLKLVIVAQE